MGLVIGQWTQAEPESQLCQFLTVSFKVLFILFSLSSPVSNDIMVCHLHIGLFEQYRIPLKHIKYCPECIRL